MRQWSLYNCFDQAPSIKIPATFAVLILMLCWRTLLKNNNKPWRFVVCTEGLRETVQMFPNPSGQLMLNLFTSADWLTPGWNEAKQTRISQGSLAGWQTDGTNSADCGVVTSGSTIRLRLPVVSERVKAPWAPPPPSSQRELPRKTDCLFIGEQPDTI